MAPALSRRWRQAPWLMVAALVALPPAARSDSGAPDAEPLSRAERSALFDNLRQAWNATDAKQWQRCLELLAASQSLARRDWSHTALSWFGRHVHCEIERRLQAGTPASAAPFDEVLAPGLQHFANAPIGAERRTGARMDLNRQRWRLMIAHGLGAQAEAEELALVSSLFTQAQPAQARHAAQPSAAAEAEAHEDLERWASGFYGQHQELDRALRWERWVEQRHGPAHFSLLHLLRAQSFTYRSTGRDAEALAVMNRAAALTAEHHAGDERLRMLVGGERAPALAANGLLVEARDEFLQLRDWMLGRQEAQRSNLMRMNYHLAGIALALGDFDAAIDYAEASIAHAEKSELPNDLVEAGVPTMIRAEAKVLRGDAGAVEGLRQHLDQYGHRDSSSGAAAFTLAKHAARTGDAPLQQWARDFLARFADAKLQPMQAERALAEVAAAWSAAPADASQARALLARALTRSLPGRDAALSVQTSFALAGDHAASAPDTAIWLYKRGANALQALRSKVSMPDEGLHRAWLADHEADLRRFIGLLIDQGRLPEAQQAIRVLREEELHEYTRRSRRATRSEARRPLAFAPPEQRQETRLAPVVQRMLAEQLLADARVKPMPIPSLGTEREWQDDPSAEQALAEVAEQVRQLVAAMPPTPAANEGSTRLDRRAAAAGLQAREVRLRYFVRSERVDIVVEDARGFHRRSVPLAREVLNGRIHAWRQSLALPQRDALPDAQQLYDWLIRPVQGRIGQARTLIVAADGALRYVPFAALHDGQRYLAQRHAVAMQLDAAPATGETPTTRRPAAPARLWLAAFGRTTADEEHTPLPGVAAELQGMQRLQHTRRTSGLGVQVARDAAFTKEALRTALERRPTVVHMASHFVLSSGDEERSYLLLGDGTRLSLTELSNLPWQQVHLALLSACDSGVADSPVQGRQLTGLAGVLRSAGVANVLATLWPIDDGATAEWVGSFYASWGQPGATRLPSSQWVAAAQRQWLERHAGTPKAHPHYWAAFAWMGR